MYVLHSESEFKSTTIKLTPILSSVSQDALCVCFADADSEQGGTRLSAG